MIFVVDSQTKFFENNIESLRELKRVSKEGLIKEIPLIIMLNKQDLEDVISEEDFKDILIEEKLWIAPEDLLSSLNPPLYKTCALHNAEYNIYESFSESERRVLSYLNDDANFPYPFIFKPPKPPDDLALAFQVQKKSEADDLYWKGLHCPHCSNPISEGQNVCPNCGSKVR